MKSEKYNGWNNYETWLVNLHIDNDRGLAEMKDEQVEAFIEKHGESGEEEETDIGELAHILKEWFEDIMEEFSPTDSLPCFYRDCIQSVLRSVDWYEIAENALRDRE